MSIYEKRCKGTQLLRPSFLRYDESQPRHPEGSSEGGQWSGNGSGSVLPAIQEISNYGGLMSNTTLKKRREAVKQVTKSLASRFSGVQGLTSNTLPEIVVQPNLTVGGAWSSMVGLFRKPTRAASSTGEIELAGAAYLGSKARPDALGGWTVGMNFEGVARHELGHAVLHWAGKDIRAQWGSLSNSISPGEKAAISRYSAFGGDAEEFFAECFSAYTSSTKSVRDGLPKTVIALMRKTLKGKK